MSTNIGGFNIPVPASLRTSLVPLPNTQQPPMQTLAPAQTQVAKPFAQQFLVMDPQTRTLKAVTAPVAPSQGILAQQLPQQPAGVAPGTATTQATPTTAAPTGTAPEKTEKKEADETEHEGRSHGKGKKKGKAKKRLKKIARELGYKNFGRLNEELKERMEPEARRELIKRLAKGDPAAVEELKQVLGKSDTTPAGANQQNTAATPQATAPAPYSTNPFTVTGATNLANTGTTAKKTTTTATSNFLRNQIFANAARPLEPSAYKPATSEY